MIREKREVGLAPQVLRRVWFWVGLTPSKSRRSRRCRGMMVTCSISQRKATSAGRRPWGCGKAIFDVGPLLEAEGFFRRIKVQSKHNRGVEQGWGCVGHSASTRYAPSTGMGSFLHVSMPFPFITRLSAFPTSESLRVFVHCKESE